MSLLERIRAIFGRRDKPLPEGLTEVNEVVDVSDYQSKRDRYDKRTPEDIAATPGAEATERTLRTTGLMPVVSSWAAGIRYIANPRQVDTGTLYVGFHDGALVAYDNTPFGLYDEMFAAGSKGRFIHTYLYKRPYRLLIAGTRSPRRRRA